MAVEEGGGAGRLRKGGEEGAGTHHSDWINQSPPPRGIWELEGQIVLNS